MRPIWPAPGPAAPPLRLPVHATFPVAAEAIFCAIRWAPQWHFPLHLAATDAAITARLTPAPSPLLQSEVYNPKAIARLNAQGPAQIGVTLHRKHDAPAGAYYTGGPGEGYMFYLRCGLLFGVCLCFSL